MAEENNVDVATDADKTTETVEKAAEKNFSEVSPKEVDEKNEELEKPVVKESVRLSHFQRTDIHSPYTRYGFPLFLIMTLALLIVADFSNGIIIKGYSDFAWTLPDSEEETEREYEPDDKLNMYILTKELWDEGAYAMSVMTCIFSVIWPFLKLIALFTFWFFPFDAKHPKKRYMEFWIECAEQCGKWSLLEVYMLICYIVIFSMTSVAEGK